MRTKFAILLAIAVVCVTTAWASWTPEVLVSGGDAGRAVSPGNARKVVFGTDGVGHLVWYCWTGGIGCNRYNPISGWTTDYQVSQSGQTPSIALDADGITIHVVWDDTVLRYRKCTRNQDGSDGWGPVVPLYTSAHAREPAMVSVPGDPNHLVACYGWSYSSRGKLSAAIAFIECINGVWTTERRLDSAASVTRIRPTIAVAPNGDVFIAYVGSDDNASGRQIYVKTRHNGVWGTTTDVTASLQSDQCTDPAIEVNTFTNNPHVVLNWYRVTQISRKVKDTTSAVYHTYRTSQGAWQTPRPVSVPRHGGSGGVLMHAPTIAFVSAGTAYAAWHEDFPVTSRGNMYSYYSGEGGTWGAPAWLTSDTTASYSDEHPHVAVDEASQTVHVVWDRWYPFHGGETEIWWRSSALGGGGGMGRPVALSQSRIELFPNPARSGRVTVQYSLPRAGEMTVTLLDVSGRAVKSQGIAATGSKGSFALDASGLNPGVYILKLDTGTGNLTRKLVIE